MIKFQKKLKISPNHSENENNLQKCRKKMGFSKIRGFLKRVRNEFEMWYLALDRKNIRCAEISGFGRNFCHFYFRRSFFSKNVKKLHFFKNAKSKFFSYAVVCKCPFVRWQWQRIYQDAPESIWSPLDVSGGS